jgi:hypothetical protein
MVSALPSGRPNSSSVTRPPAPSVANGLPDSAAEKTRAQRRRTERTAPNVVE